MKQRKINNNSDSNMPTLTKEEEKFLFNFRALNSEDKQKLKDLILSFDIDEPETK